MIKLKDILLESDIFIPRRVEDRVERMIKEYVRNGSKGDLLLNNMNLTELPEILKNVSVSGYFNCGGNELTNLKNSPKIVYGNFYCQNIGLESLEGAPEFVNGEFNCSNNKLTSLEGIPKTVGGDLYIRNNPVKFTKEQIKAVCNVKGDVFV